MHSQQTLRVAEAEQTESGTHARELQTWYSDADAVTLTDYGRKVPDFVAAVLDTLDMDMDADNLRRVSEIDDPDDVHFGVLLVCPDETLLFVGSDPTAKDAPPWFAFTIAPTEPMPAPDTAQGALDLLKPPSVKDIEARDAFLPDRHGEWWLLPCNLVPGGTVFKPGVGRRPYGPSPLGNHVPQRYAFTVPDHTFMSRVRDVVNLPDSVGSPPEVLDWVARHQRKQSPSPTPPTWHEIRECAGNVIVRGSIRHRDDDHYVQQLGDVWHKAVTHNIEVYTADDMVTDIHLDYYGGE